MFVRDDTATHEAIAGGSGYCARNAVDGAEVGGVGVLAISCALAVYLGAVLLARLAVWAYFS